MLAAHLILPIVSNLALLGAGALSRGVSIALTGMLIVACALLLICLFIMSLPRVLAAIAKVWPEGHEPHPSTARAEGLVPEEDEILAAIGFLLHHRLHRREEGSASSSQAT